MTDPCLSQPLFHPLLSQVSVCLGFRAGAGSCVSPGLFCDPWECGLDEPRVCVNSKGLGARDGGSHISLSMESGQTLGLDEIPAGAAFGVKG